MEILVVIFQLVQTIQSKHSKHLDFEKVFFLIDNGLPSEGIYADFSDDKNINEIDKSELEYLIKLSLDMIDLLAKNENIDRDRAKISLSTTEPFKTNWEFIEEKI